MSEPVFEPREFEPGDIVAWCDDDGTRRAGQVWSRAEKPDERWVVDNDQQVHLVARKMLAGDLNEPGLF